MRYGTQYFYHTAFTVAAALLNGVLFYVLRVVLYHNLAFEDYGLFYAVLSFSLVVHPLLSVGFDPGTIPYVTRFRERRDHEGIKDVVLGSLVPQAVLGIGLMAVVMVLAETIALKCFGTVRAASLLRTLAVFTCLLLPFKAGQALLLGLQRIPARNLADLTRVAVTLAAAAALLHLGYGVEAAALAYTISVGAGLLVVLVAVGALYPALIRARFRWRPSLVAEVFRSGKFLTLAFGGVLVFSHMDTMMLTLVLGDYRAVAAYQVAIPTMMILYALLFAGSANFMPMVTTMWHRGEKDLLADGVGRIYEAAVVLILPATVLMACYSDLLMETLFRRDILNAPEAFNILAVGSVLLFTCHLNLHILAGIDRARSAGMAIAWALCANVILNLVLIRFLGIRGAALATVLSHAAATSLSFASIRKELLIRARLGSVVATLLICSCAALACAWLRHTAVFHAYPRLIALGSGAALYSMALAALELAGCSRLRELGRIIVRGGRLLGG